MAAENKMATAASCSFSNGIGMERIIGTIYYLIFRRRRARTTALIPFENLTSIFPFLPLMHFPSGLLMASQTAPANPGSVKRSPRYLYFIAISGRFPLDYGLPKAGWWGICALNLDDGAQHEGKELSVDAVLWIKATDMTP